MAKIYWFTGQPSAGKTVLAKKLVEFLQTEKRNWRKKVFHLDGDDLRDLTKNQDYSKEGRITNIQRAQSIAEYLYKNDCDVVVSLVAPYRDVRNEFKEKIGKDFEEFYVHTTQKRERDKYHSKDYEPPTTEFFDVDTTKDNPVQSFNKIIHYLTEKHIA
jgi:adenylylsulfate kinase-like enzyme